MLLTGGSGSGKTYLVKKLIDRFTSAFSPNQIVFAIFDHKQLGLWDDVNNPSDDYLLFTPETNPAETLNKLEVIATLLSEGGLSKRMFIYIEECDAAVLDQARFDAVVTQINDLIRGTNSKLIYATSRKSQDTVSDKLGQSFDLELNTAQNERYGFMVYEKSYQAY